MTIREKYDLLQLDTVFYQDCCKTANIERTLGPLSVSQ